MLASVSVVILIAVSIGLYCAFRGPTLYDRVLSVNMVGTQTVLIVAVLGFLTDRPEFLDIALVYVLISFVSTLAVLRVFCNPCTMRRSQYSVSMPHSSRRGLSQAFEVPARVVHVGLLDLDVVGMDHGLDVDVDRLVLFAHHLAVDLAGLGHVDGAVALHQGLAAQAVILGQRLPSLAETYFYVTDRRQVLHV